MSRDLEERTVDTELAWQGAFLRVRKDRVRLPDGSIHGREWVEHPGAAAIAVLRDDGFVLIERQYRYAMRQVYIEIPAGKKDPGETTLQTAKRELLEETGHVAAQWALLTQLHPAIGFSNEVMDVYLARELTLCQEARPEHGELLEVDWVRLGWLVDALRAGRLHDVKTHIAVMHLERMADGDWPWPEFQPA